MLLAIDIGNSTIKFGVYDRETLISRFAIPTDRNTNADQLDKIIKSAEMEGLARPGETPGTADNKLQPPAIAGGSDWVAVIISSVVPELENPFREFCEKHLGVKPVFVDHTFDFGLKIKYDPVSSLGTDRLIAAFAAVRKYGSPCIVCDFGTATTIDAVNAGGEFLGGVITPGMNPLSEALHLNTSKLPSVSIEKPSSVFGNTTIGSIQSGIFYGYIGLVEGILTRMIREIGETPKVIATGGFAKLIAENCELIEIVDENLMLDGLRLLHA